MKTIDDEASARNFFRIDWTKVCFTCGKFNHATRDCQYKYKSATGAQDKAGKKLAGEYHAFLRHCCMKCGRTNHHTSNCKVVKPTPKDMESARILRAKLNLRERKKWE